MSRYVDFDLSIERSGAGYVARVVRSPAGEGEHAFDWPFTDQDLELFVLRIGHTRAGVRRSGSPQMGHARDFGRELFDTVFQGTARTAFLRSLDAADREESGLRIRLRLAAAPELHDVPWEFLYSDDLHRFLIVSAETPIVRYLDLPRRIRPLEVTLPLHVLVVAPAPTDLPSLDVAGEWSRLRNALEPMVEGGFIELELLETPTLEALQGRLRHSPVHVLHFVGHGAFEAERTGMLFFVNELGGSHPVSGEDLGTLLHDHRQLRLVVLNSCEGARSDASDPFAGSAQALVVQGVPAVIAMQFEVSDRAALAIAKNFYAALADGYAVDAALAEARKAVFSQGNDVEWGTPVLYMRAPDGRLFELGDRPAETAAEAIAEPPVPEAVAVPVEEPEQPEQLEQDGESAAEQKAPPEQEAPPEQKAPPEPARTEAQITEQRPAERRRPAVRPPRPYSHTEAGVMMGVAAALILIPTVMLAGSLASSEDPGAGAIVFAFGVLIGLPFLARTKITVTVDERRISIKYLIGWPKHIRIERVAGVARVKLSRWALRKGRRHGIKGWEGVQITETSGRATKILIDDPDGLHDAIASRIEDR